MTRLLAFCWLALDVLANSLVAQVGGSKARFFEPFAVRHGSTG
jgi:hypothetical protein